MTEQVRSELDAWSLVPPAEADGEEDATRQDGVWHDALQAGPLVLVEFQGIVGNTAFPAWVQIDLDRFEPAGLAAGSDRRRETEHRRRDRPGVAYAVRHPSDGPSATSSRVPWTRQVG